MNYSFFHLKRILYNIHVISSSSMFHIMKFVPVIFSQLHTFLAYLLQTDQARYRLILIRSKQYKFDFIMLILNCRNIKAAIIVLNSVYKSNTVFGLTTTEKETEKKKCT